ncbi:MAG: glycogen synthase, partial [Candidatus Zixiibacteriota bacterium]
GSEELFGLDLQMVILGTGDKEIEKELLKIEKKYPAKLKVYLKFDEKLAHMIEAGADIFMMPSHFEPCGLNQMYSLKYGTPPLVHRVGGLADTVVDFNEKTGAGTGFVFEEFNVKSMIIALRRANELFSQKRKWTKLMKNGMKQDYSWSKSAGKYTQLFESLTGSK